MPTRPKIYLSQLGLSIQYIRKLLDFIRILRGPDSDISCRYSEPIFVSEPKLDNNPYSLFEAYHVALNQLNCAPISPGGGNCVTLSFQPYV